MTAARSPALLIAACVVLSPAYSAAQESAVGAAVGLSSRQKGDDDSSYLYPGFGGTGLAGIVFVDAALTLRISVGGEISLAAAIEETQSQRAPGGFYLLESHHTDTTFLGTIKFALLSSNRIGLNTVGGAGVARRHTERSGPLVPFTPGLTSPPKDEELSSAVFAFSGGADFVVSGGEHLDLLLLGRFYVLATNDRRPDGTVERGVSNVIVRYGAGARVRF